MNKIFVKKDKRYEELVKDLYEHGALNKDDFEIITKPNKVKNLKDYAIEKDDIEH